MTIPYRITATLGGIVFCGLAGFAFGGEVSAGQSSGVALPTPSRVIQGGAVVGPYVGAVDQAPAVRAPNRLPGPAALAPTVTTTRSPSPPAPLGAAGPAGESRMSDGHMGQW